MRKDAKTLVATYAKALSESGTTLAALGWPNAGDLAQRFETLLAPLALRDVPLGKKVRLLDVGCAFALLLDYLDENALLDRVDYLGVDLFDETLAAARDRWPGHRFERRDVRDEAFPPASFDYAILCGGFHDRYGLTYYAMKRMAEQTLKSLWPSVTVGLGFTAMSKHVDWERDNLFYWPLDDIMSFCKANLSRYVALHVDYGLWETTALVFKEPRRRMGRIPSRWSEKVSK